MYRAQRFTYLQFIYFKHLNLNIIIHPIRQVMDYGSIVLELLDQKKYPVLEGHVLLDIYYKMIPIDHVSRSCKRYDRRVINPEDVYIRDAEPFSLNYLTPFGQNTFYMHHLNTLSTESFQLECIRIKLMRSFVDSTILNRSSISFEEEIYNFLTLLNHDVPRICSIINLNFLDSTRCLPQRIKLWVFKYSEHTIIQKPLTHNERLCFGPLVNPGVIPIRVISGRLSECTSQTTLLSLNNHYEFPHLTYTHHFSEKWKTIIPLAFNPLENPIITL